MAFAGCAKEDYRTYDFKVIDCTKKSDVKLVALHGELAVQFLYIHIKGKLDGEGTILWAKAGKTIRVSGDVDLGSKNEWYETECQLEYTPIAVKSGELTIYYKFEEM